MTVSAKVRKSLPPSRMGKPGSDEYPMPDKRHAAIAKGFAAMHHDPDKASIDAKANKILAAKRGGFIGGGFKKPHLGRPGRQMGGAMPKRDDFSEGTTFPGGDWGRYTPQRGIQEQMGPMSDEDARRVGLAGAKQLLKMGYAGGRPGRSLGG